MRLVGKFLCVYDNYDMYSIPIQPVFFLRCNQTSPDSCVFSSCRIPKCHDILFLQYSYSYVFQIIRIKEVLSIFLISNFLIVYRLSYAMFPDNNMFKLRGFSKLQCCPIVCHVIFFAILSMHTINSGESVKICILNFKQKFFIVFFTYSQLLSCQ